MQTWLRSLSASTKGRKSSRKNRRSKPEWRAKFDALDLSIERLEDRTLLAVDIGFTPVQPANPPIISTSPVLFTYTVQNNDTLNPTTGATFTDTYTAPAGTVVTLSDSLHDLTATTITPYTSGTTENFATQLPASAIDTINVSFALAANSSGVITNAANVNETGDTNPANNSVTSTPVLAVTTAVTPTTVSVSKSVPAGQTPVVGAPLTYDVTITNLGSAAVTNVSLLDNLGTGETFLSATDGKNSFAPVAPGGNVITGTVSLGSTGASATDTVTVVAVPTAAGTVTNTAAIAVAGNTNANVTATANAVVAAAPAVTVNVSKSSSASTPVSVGSGPLTYTVTITNGTATPVTTVQVVDQLPANETFSSASPGLAQVTGSPNQVTGTVSLAGNGTDTLTIVANPTAAGLATNTASIAVPGGNAGTTQTASATNTILASTNTVSVAKTGPATGTVGAPLTYNVTITNGGVGAVTGVVLTDKLDANETFVSATDAAGDTFTNNNGTITGTVSLGITGTDTVTVVATPKVAASGGSVVNTASIAINGTGGNSSATTSASVTSSVSASANNVSIGKTAPATGTVGTGLAETITLTNAGTSATTASAVTLTDVLPANETYLSASDTLGSSFSFNPATRTLTGTIKSIASGSSGNVDTVTVNVLPTAAGTATDTASVSVTGGNQAATTSTSASTNVTAAAATAANVNVGKTAPATATAGSLVTETITLTNAGSSAATNLAFSDLFSGSAFTFVSVSDTAGSNLTYNPSTNAITGNVASIANGSSGNVDTVTIELIPTAAGTLTDTASINITGGNQGTSSTSASTNVTAGATPSNVSITKSGPTNATVNSPVTDTITLTNSGSSAATNVAVVDILPANVSNVTASNGLTFANGQVSGTIASLATGPTTLTVVYTPTKTGTSTDTASIGIPAGNSSTTIAASASTTVTAAPTAQLVISKTGNPASIGAGGTETYTVTVTNVGGAAATGASVTDNLPAGLTLVKATDATTGSVVTIIGNNVTDALASLAAGGTDTLIITATVGQLTTGTTVTNTATLNFNGTQSASFPITISGPPVGQGFFLQSKPGDGTVTTGVTNLYWNLLGRGPDPVGLQSWVAYGTANQNAAGDQAIVSGFMNSPEYKAHYVTAVYQIFLGRGPDAGGLEFWTEKMGNPGTPGGATGSADEKYVLAAILGSDEFYGDSGGTPTGWVNALYMDLLNRAPDGSGSAFWQNELAKRGPGDRDGIVRDLLSTPEAVHDLLDMFYPAPGGTAATPLPQPGSPAGTGGDKLAQLTGGGWENLYFAGPYDSQQEGNDAFFNELVGGAAWDQVQYQMLTTQQYFTNPNRPILTS
jgi:uncharacterized repeat protein (TIGR01451 family)